MDRIETIDDPHAGGEADSDRPLPHIPARVVPTANPPRPRPLRHSSVGIRRLSSIPSIPSIPQVVIPPAEPADRTGQDEPSGRRRSSSEPQRPNWATPHRASAPGLSTDRAGPSTGRARASTITAQIPPIAEDSVDPAAPPEVQATRLRRASAVARSALRLRRPSTAHSISENPDDEYESDIVNLLDVLDPEVSTLATLTNVQNSLFIPDLGNFLNRRPTYTLTRRPSYMETPSPESVETEEPAKEEGEETEKEARDRLKRTPSTRSDLCYAVLPDGVSLEGWSVEDRRDLDDHVRHMLHSRRAGFKRSMKGFAQYTRRPLGFFVTVYATLITLFGLAWVLFLIGWINVGGRQSYIVNVIDNVLVALFAVMGDGLAPFRAVDTYHMIFIAHYHYLTWHLRRKRALPDLQNENDLPAKHEAEVDLEDGEEAGEEFSVLTLKQQKRLVHHQKKFSRSHTFYKPHETTTHFAFPLRLLIAIVVLLDCHSLLQIALGTCTWAISYHVRPFALTTVILCCSITCNITGGVLIAIGDRKTRKKDVLEQLFRKQLTEQAMHKLEKRKNKEMNRNPDLEDKEWDGTKSPTAGSSA